MPEQFLDRFQIHAGHDQVAGETMPECENWVPRNQGVDTDKPLYNRHTCIIFMRVNPESWWVKGFQFPAIFRKDTFQALAISSFIVT